MTINKISFQEAYERALVQARESEQDFSKPWGKGRLSVRAHTYRGTEGFSVSGKSPWQHDIRIFVKTREGAEKIQDAYNKGELSQGEVRAITDAVLMSGR